MMLLTLELGGKSAAIAFDFYPVAFEVVDRWLEVLPESVTIAALPDEVAALLHAHFPPAVGEAWLYGRNAHLDGLGLSTSSSWATLRK